MNLTGFLGAVPMSRLVWAVVVGVLLLLACVTSQPQTNESTGTAREAFSSSATVSWNGGQAALDQSTCTVCGTDYACADGTGNWNNGTKTFTDPTPPGSLVTSVTLSVFDVGCGTTAQTVSVELNGTTIGSFTDGTGCLCGTCDPTHTLTLNNAGGIPGYKNNGQTNTILVVPQGTADPCV